MATHSSILVWNIPVKNGQRSLAGYKTWGLKESDTTERAHTHTHTHTLGSRGGSQITMLMRMDDSS